MYLEPIRSFGAGTPITNPALNVRCKDGSWDTSRGIVAPCLTKGGVALVTGGYKPTPKPKFMPSYGLKANYSYGACKTGYVKSGTFRPDPDAYACFDPAELAWNKKNGIMF